jgi:hypothetical protein
MANGKGQSDAEFKGYTKAKLENIEKMMSDFIEAQNDCNKDLYKRVDNVENDQSKWKGMMIGISGTISIVGGIIGGILRGVFGGR